MFQWLKKGLALLAAAALCGCTPVGMSTEEMLHPPALSPEQAALSAALESALGTDGYQLKYPRRGDYLSAFVFKDLDGDGGQEVVVFYEMDIGDSATWLSVLDQDQEGQWHSVYDVPGLGPDVDFIDFAPITQLGRPNILVGWTLPGREDCRLAVYEYAGNRLESLFDDYYTETLLADVDQNGLTDLLIFSMVSGRPPMVRLAALQAEGLVATSQAMLSTRITGCSQLLFGQLAENMPALFVDVQVDDSYETTEILAVEGLELERLTEEEGPFYERFVRPLGALGCWDLDGNGLVDIPSAQAAPGYEQVGEGEEQEVPQLTYFHQMQNGSFVVSAVAAVNRQAGYLLRFPQLWENNVTLRTFADSGEWRFYVYNGSLEQSVTELARIKTLAASDARDPFAIEGYQLVGRRGSTEFYGYIPEVQGGFSIDYAQLQACFVLLP